MRSLAKLLILIACFSSSLLSAQTTSVMAIDSSGNLVSLWLESVNNNYCVKAATKAKAASSWTTPVTISDPSTNSFSPKLVVDATGNAVAVWTSELVVNTYLSHALYGSQLPSGGNWTSSAMISSSSFNVLNLSELCIDTQGDVSVLWYANNATTGASDYFSASTTIGGNWSDPVQVSQQENSK